MGLLSSSSKSKSYTTTVTTSKPVTLQDVEAMAIAGNDLSSSQLTITDSGAIAGGLTLAGDVVKEAADLTMAVIERQQAISADTLAAMVAGQKEANEFAIAGGREEVAMLQDITRILLVVGGIIAVGFAIRAARG